MAIYKLGDIAILKSGSTPERNNKDFWNEPNLKWLTSGEVKPNIFDTREKINSNKFKKRPFKKGSPVMAMYGATAGKVGYLGDSMYVNQAVCVFESNQQLILDRYLYYLLESESKKLILLTSGAAQQNLSLGVIENHEVNLPSIEEQQKIIDIIEPIEFKKNNLEKINGHVVSLLKKISNSKTKDSKNFLIDYITFEKGKNGPKNFETYGTPFLDVKTLNSRIPSKFVKFEPNTFKGDILLSLDATVGLIDWFIEGYNGYLYNLKSDILSKAEILINLFNNVNKNIIKMNSIGSTIKHASRAKKELIYFEIEKQWKKIVIILFKLLLLVEEINDKTILINNLLIELLIK